jgi:hypothetical protein
LVVTSDPELEPEEQERLIRQLSVRLRELDLDSMDSMAGGPAPDRAKGPDPVTLGAILLTLSASGGVLTALVETLRDWLGRRATRNRISVTVDGDTIELDAASEVERSQLIDAYLRRHSGE